jgi:hypothetical protein
MRVFLFVKDESNRPYCKLPQQNHYRMKLPTPSFGKLPKESGRVNLRSLVRGNSMALRIAVFIMMSAVFLLLVSVTERKGHTKATEENLTSEDSTTVKPPRSGKPTVTNPRTQPKSR